MVLRPAVVTVFTLPLKWVKPTVPRLLTAVDDPRTACIEIDTTSLGLESPRYDCCRMTLFYDRGRRADKDKMNRQVELAFAHLLSKAFILPEKNIQCEIDVCRLLVTVVGYPKDGVHQHHAN